MPQKIIILCTLIIATMGFNACVKEESENLVQEELFIEPLLKPYFDRFEQEGLDRDITVDLSAARIEAYLEDIEGNKILGQCQYTGDEPRKVIVDQAFWNQSTELQREFVIFHELGHCYLNRSHDNSKKNNGQCSSMMQSGTGSCSFSYNQFNRSAYLDELFQE